MGYKEILVTVDTAPAGAARLDLAAALAERFEAHLIGLHTSLTPLGPRCRGLFRSFRSLAARSSSTANFPKGGCAREQAAQSLFEDVAKQAGLAAEWRVPPAIRPRTPRCTAVMSI